MMEEIDGSNLFSSVISVEEWNEVPSETAKKLESFVNEKFEEFLTSQALLETKRYNAEQSLSELQGNFETVTNNHSNVSEKLEAAQETINELETQLTTCTAEVSKLQSTCNKLETETAEFRHQRNLAVDERDELLQMMERRNAELERMKVDINLLTTQLEAAVNAKCEALAHADEVASMKITLEYREKRIDQERNLLNSQMQTLTQDLNQRTEEILNMRRDNTSRCIQLEGKLNEKIQELAIATETVKNITEINNKLTAKAEELTEKLYEQRELDANTHESYQHELEAQTKLADLYKGMSEENKQLAEELSKGINELQVLLKNASEQYGDLETKYRETELAQEEILSKKNECITVLKKELNDSNEMFKNMKEESIRKEVEGFSPTAASTSRLIRSGMSMTQIYTQLTQVSDDLLQEKEENRRLNSYIDRIITEIEEKGPLLKKQREDYERALETISELTKQSDGFVMENHQLREEAIECKRSEGIAIRENERYKREVADLARQVCHLLREVENSRTASSSTSTDQDISDSASSSADIITKRLVTFSDITELQSNNQKLVALVRELTARQEEAENFDPSEFTKLQAKLETMRESQADTLQQLKNQTALVNSLISQKDMYKMLYQQIMKSNGEDIPMQLDQTCFVSGSPKPHDETESHSESKIEELGAQLQKAKKEIETLKEENTTFCKEKSINDNMLVEQMEKMRKDMNELTRQNCKLSSVAEMNDERFKILNSNVEVYKNQVLALEKQNKIYSETVIKHENSLTYLKDELLNSETKLSHAEVMLANLQKENALLRDAESRLSKDVELYKRESHAQNLLQTNVELIKATLERNDAESRIRLESRVDEAYRECAALRRRLAEEQTYFRELTEQLEKQTKVAQDRMEEEKQQADKLRNELAEVREDLITKSSQIEELSKKIKNSILNIPEGNVDARRLRQLEHSLSEGQAEVNNLQQQLKIAREAITQHCSVAEGAENQLKELMVAQTQYRESVEEKLQQQETLISELREKLSEVEGELSIQTDGQEVTTLDLKSSLHKLSEQYRISSEDLTQTKEQLDKARAEIKILSANLETAENKYSHEMVLHSADLQALNAVKEDFLKTVGEVNELKHAREQAVDALEESKASWEVQERLFQNEKVEVERRFKDMDAQNNLLLDQIQNLNNQLSILQVRITGESSFNQSQGELNRSLTEDEVKSSDQLLKIIKFLRQEKDISVSKCDILDAEHGRLKSQQEFLIKQLEETKTALESERQKSEISIVTTSKHAQVLRQVETLNAITDSNRSLRIERDSLVTQINELRARVSGLEEQLMPLQEKNKELTKKSDALQNENVTLRSEATRWRQRANILIEKSNRTSPEDWKKLQNERETLAKQLTIERGITAKLNDELNTLKQDKSKLEEQLKSLSNQNKSQSDELEKLREELGKLREEVSNLSQTLEQANQKHAKLVEENRLLTEDTAGKDVTITDLKNNLFQIRKIAKKYKTQCEDLAKEIEQFKQQNEAKKAEDAASAEKEEQLLRDTKTEYEEKLSQLEQSNNEKLSELTQQVTSTNAENEGFKKEIESLKQSSLEKEERFKSLFKNAKDRIMNLTDQNTALKVEVSNQGRSNRSENSGSDNQTNELLADVERLEKEKEDILAEKQQEKEKMQGEIETLSQRITQLQRQLGQQGSKPSTSSGPSEKSTLEPPTASIKPVPGHSTNTQTQSISIQPWRSANETPLASIRPISLQSRTVAVLPTSQSPSAVIVPTQQVHTTGPGNVEVLSSSPTSSHTEYMPATSSATPAVVGPRQVAVPPTQSTQDSTDEDNNMQAQPAPQQQAVALVLPRVEPPTSASAQESGTSSSSSNTVTTTQASLKRPREADTDSCQVEEQSKAQPQIKRTRVQQGTAEAFQGVTESGLEVEYQVPTSSQRDHEEDPDAIIVVESDEEGDGPDEGEGADDDPDDADDAEVYDMEATPYSERELNYEDADCHDMEEDEEGGNEVEFIEDLMDVPNQSERSIQEGSCQEESAEQAQSEATSSGTDGTSGVTQSVPATMTPFSTRTRPVAPLTRQQQQTHLLLPHGLEEGGDDGIVPSTPTLFVPRRADGFGEAVSSPHVPTSGRFTFNENAPPNNTSSNEVIPEQTLEIGQLDDNSTGRSVPSTPLQASPQEAGPSGEDQSSQQTLNSEVDIPTITVSGAGDEATATPEASAGESMGPPSTAGTSTETTPQTERRDDMLEGDDGVTSEGEKATTPEEAQEEEGREAEATPSVYPHNTRSRTSGVARRSVRNSHMRGNARPTPTPIVWTEQHYRTTTRYQENLQRRGGASGNFSPRVARRSRGRSQANYGRYEYKP